uniref:Ribosomal protein S4 n=1 Tax=Kryptoperidinium foliaceum endosymbiont TaxID=1079369 RepID=I6N5R2_9STRA|nr:ribosomal protein S4 [Kryptoperidinium foliaceum endosymbiont]
MITKKRHKPFYKQFLRLRRNVQNRPKLLKFKKQKWVRFQQYSKNQLKFFKRFKIKDQFQLSVSKFASRGNSFQRKFRNNLYERKAFSLFYGKLKKKYLKKYILRFIKSKRSFNNSVDFRQRTLRFFESRLNTVLYRSNFSLSIQSASQLILHGHVQVNGVPVKTKSYILKPNDIIEIAPTLKARNLVKKSLERSNFWPIPPKHLLINYKTLQILFMYTETANLMPAFNHYLNINSVITNIKKY